MAARLRQLRWGHEDKGMRLSEGRGSDDATYFSAFIFLAASISLGKTSKASPTIP